MFDGPMIIRVNLPAVDTIQLKSNRFVIIGVNIKATGVSNINVRADQM